MLVLVTGASSGFGEAIVERFAKEGHRVIAAARRKERLDALAKRCNLNQQEKVLPVSLDVTDKSAIQNMLTQLPLEWKDIDVLVNNAGLALGVEPAHQCSLEDWETMIDTNNKGLVRMTHALLPHFIKKNSGMIINIGSIAGSTPYPGGNVYGATKAFVEQFTLNLKADLIGTHVRASNIAPALCGGTEFSNVRFKGDDHKAAAVYEGTTPLTANDIAETTYWIATLPPHVNVNYIELMPTCQGFGALNIKRV